MKYVCPLFFLFVLLVKFASIYRQHAAELGNAVPDEPLLFMKPTTSYVREGSPIVVSD